MMQQPAEDHPETGAGVLNGDGKKADAVGYAPPAADGANGNTVIGVKRERPARQQKTQEQWAGLEAAFLMDSYPSEEQYQRLATNLVLSVIQVREWFCKRRKKSRGSSDAVGAASPSSPAGGPGGEAKATAAGAAGSPQAGTSGLRDLGGVSNAPATAAFPAAGPTRRRRRGTEAMSNLTEISMSIIAKAKSHLEVEGKLSFRPTGPRLALYFDPIPPIGRSARFAGSGSKRLSARQAERQELNKLLSRVREEERNRRKEELDSRKREIEELKRQRQAEREAERALKMQLKLEAMEKRELERQRRMQEKLERERELQELKRQREEERAKARIEKQLMKEELKRKREEELQERKRLREFERMKAAEERAQAKLDQERRKQLVEDEDLERQEIAEEMKRKAAAAAANGAAEAMEVDPKDIVLPKFPPKSVDTVPLFEASGDLAADLAVPEIQQDLLMVWKFVRDYHFVINARPMGLAELAGAVSLGVESRPLAELHMSLLKLLLADVEESHSLVNQEDGFEHKGGQISGLDRVVHNFAKHLGEIWEWHFGSDLLRAQRNFVTWPEVLRQFLVILGYGPERPKLRKKTEAGVGDKRKDGEGPKMKPPATCRPGTIKGAAWVVLKEAGVEGLTSVEITDKMNELGLRTGSQGGVKTPEASVNGALSRDSFVFEKVGNHKYALRVLCSWHRRQVKRQKDLAEGKVQEQDEEAKAAEEEAAKAAEGEEGKSPTKKEQMELEERRRRDDQRRRGELWVRKLAVSEYNDLSVAERLSCLSSLCSAVLECPSLYQQIEASLREKDQYTKRLREVQRDEKKLRQSLVALVGPAAMMKANDGSGAANIHPEGSEAAHIQAELDSVVLERTQIVNRLSVLTEEVNRLPLGLDRRHNRYWHVSLGGRDDEVDALLIMESSEDHSLRLVRDKESLDALVCGLNPRGMRESKLLDSLKVRSKDLLSCLPSKPLAVSLPQPDREFIARYPTEASTILQKEGRKPNSQLADFASEKLVSKFLVEKLKGDMLDVYQALPTDSFEDSEWDGASVWMTKVRSASQVEDLRDILGEFEGAVKAKLLDFDHFNREPRIVPGAWVPRDLDDDGEDPTAAAEEEDDVDEETEEDEDGLVGYIAQEGDVSWLPPTTSGLQYRLRCLDAVLSYRRSSRPMCKRVDAYKYIQRDNPLNKDGTNFTVVSATGQIKVMQNFTRERNLCAIPPFPPLAAVQLRGGFRLDYSEFSKSFKKLVNGVGPARVIQQQELDKGANRDAGSRQAAQRIEEDDEDAMSVDDFEDDDGDSDFELRPAN